MRFTPLVAVLGLASQLHAVHLRSHAISKRQVSLPVTPDVTVPTYFASMPLDHFNSSDTRTFSQRLFVNDTYYKPGGPVIYFDYGEEGVNPTILAWMLAEWGNGTVSAPMEVAKALNGVVVSLEHRYYGSSNPFPLNNTASANGADIVGYYGTPLGGAADYRYLTIEQALEDVVYLATEIFNKTQLANNTVLSGINATQQLDPYHTPWVWIGGSYPGMRGAWLRLRNPEIIYAVWASSAPVQVQVDGSAYYNSVYRGLPKNCSSDIQYVAESIDRIFSARGSRDLDLKTWIYVVENSESVASLNASSIQAGAANLTDYDVAATFFSSELFDTVQSFGFRDGIQVFCDLMESFDASSYLSNTSLSSSNPATKYSVWKYNNGNATPSAEGIAASNPSNASDVAIAAYLYALWYWTPYFFQIFEERSVFTTSTYEDLHSWEWQVMTQIGIETGINGSSPLRLGSALLTPEANSAVMVAQFFPAYDVATTFPPVPNTSYAESFGGWNMQPSNAMFTTGEFDPWRAYGVQSLEFDIGAPRRTLTQTVPPCGHPPEGTDVFGLIYGGAVHYEDIVYVEGETHGSEDDVFPPVKQGAALFLQALNIWLPCFNTTRGTGCGSRR